MVSYVLNDNPDVSISTETRQRIVDAVASLGYVPNAPARSLRTNRTFTIASIIPDVPIRSILRSSGASRMWPINMTTI